MWIHGRTFIKKFFAISNVVHPEVKKRESEYRITMEIKDLHDSYLGQSPHPYHPTNLHTRGVVLDKLVESDIHHHMPIPPRCQSWAPVRVLWEVAQPAAIVVLANMLRVLDKHLQDQTCCPELREDSMD
jgi:hypothetical protein